MEPQREVDITERLIAAIAEELWRLYGGDDQLNWLEAEAHLQRIVGEVKAETSAAALSSLKARAAAFQPPESEPEGTVERRPRRRDGRTRASVVSTRGSGRGVRRNPTIAA
jgi:hypothetical protein